MEMGRAILWTVAAAAGSGVIGYVSGFWQARPDVNVFSFVGALAVLAATLAIAIVVRAFIRSRSLRVASMRLPASPRIGLLWSALAIFAGVNLGAFLGFVIGLRTAQSVTDVLAVAGVVAVVAAAVAALAAIVYTRRSRRNRLVYIPQDDSIDRFVWRL